LERKKHILFISSWYPNRNNPTHGIFNYNFASAASLYHIVSVIHVCSEANLTGDFEVVSSNEQQVLSIIVYYKKVNVSIPLISHFVKWRKQLKAYKLAYSILLQKLSKPDLIQLNVVSPAGAAVLYLSKKFNIPFVVNEGWTGYMPEDGRYNNWLIKMLTKKVVSKAKAIMPVSKRLKQAMLTHNLLGNYTIVPNLVDVKSFSIANVVQKDVVSFIHISALDDAQKNVSGIISSFAKAHKQNNQMRLKIIGDGEDKLMLENLADKLNVSNVITFTGKLIGEDLVNEIQKSDALIMFSNYETFCLTVAEALACGRPVITSRAGGLTDLINEDLGISIESKNEKQLCEAMLTFVQLRKKYNPELLRNFITQNYSKEIIAEKLKQVYSDVLS
jgi:L-malate glycosyltransferase